jgi:hypothetical protein
MDDVQALQRTVRRVGAVLALLLAIPMNGGDYFQVGFVATVVAVLYLVGSFALQFLDSVDPIGAEPDGAADD